jgi:hypothetical protein
MALNSPSGVTMPALARRFRHNVLSRTDDHITGGNRHRGFATGSGPDHGHCAFQADGLLISRAPALFGLQSPLAGLTVGLIPVQSRLFNANAALSRQLPQTRRFDHIFLHSAAGLVRTARN